MSTPTRASDGVPRNRSTIKARIRDLLAAELAPVPVDYGFPVDNLQLDHVWIARVYGRKTFPFIQGGTKTVDDQFRIVLIFQAAGPNTTKPDTDDRAETYADQFIQMICEDPTLGGMDDVVHMHFDDDSYDGPNPQGTDEGSVSFVSLELSVHTRISP